MANISASPASAIPPDVDEGDLSKSANAEIPGEIVRPGLEMVVEVDPDGTLDPALGVPKRIPETGRMPVEVWEMPVLDIMAIPFLWSADPDSTIVETVDGMAADPEGHSLLEDTRILLPVGGIEVTAHEPVWSSSNSAIDLFGLFRNGSDPRPRRRRRALDGHDVGGGDRSRWDGLPVPPDQLLTTVFWIHRTRTGPQYESRSRALWAPGGTTR